MSYLVILIISSSEFLKDLENNQIYLKPKHNLIVLDKTMIEIWNKGSLELGRRKGWRDWDIVDKLTEFEACRISIGSYRCDI